MVRPASPAATTISQDAKAPNVFGIDGRSRFPADAAARSGLPSDVHRPDRRVAESPQQVDHPVRDQFGTAAERSFRWYENMRQAMQAPAMAFTYDFLTRTGRVDDARLKDYAPGFYRQYQDYRSRLASVREATA